MKISLSKVVPLVHPTPIAVIGTIFNGDVNFTTVGDLSVAGLNPPLVVVSLHRNHKATENINCTHSFSINMATPQMIEKVAYAGKHSGNDTSKSTLFECNYVGGIPITIDSMISLIVKKREEVIIENRVILICDVINTLVDEHLLSDSKLKLEQADTLVYGLDDCFYQVGKRVYE
jgi:flavin reductase (DIM6/NTAB) family NADH-FMN oxidoreductase RutF